MLYASAYGNTAGMAQAISRGITKAGVGVETLNLEVDSIDDALKAVKDAKGFIIGSPTLGGHLPTQVSPTSCHMCCAVLCCAVRGSNIASSNLGLEGEEGGLWCAILHLGEVQLRLQCAVLCCAVLCCAVRMRCPPRGSILGGPIWMG